MTRAVARVAEEAVEEVAADTRRGVVAATAVVVAVAVAMGSSGSARHLGCACFHEPYSTNGGTNAQGGAKNGTVL